MAKSQSSLWGGKGAWPGHVWEMVMARSQGKRRGYGQAPTWPSREGREHSLALIQKQGGVAQPCGRSCHNLACHPGLWVQEFGGGGVWPYYCHHSTATKFPNPSEALQTRCDDSAGCIWPAG